MHGSRLSIISSHLELHKTVLEMGSVSLWQLRGHTLILLETVLAMMVTGKKNWWDSVFFVTMWKLCTIQGSSISQEAIVWNGSHQKGTVLFPLSYPQSCQSWWEHVAWPAPSSVCRHSSSTSCLDVTGSSGVFGIAVIVIFILHYV